MLKQLIIMQSTVICDFLQKNVKSMQIRGFGHVYAFKGLGKNYVRLGVCTYMKSL